MPKWNPDDWVMAMVGGSVSASMLLIIVFLGSFHFVDGPREDPAQIERGNELVKVIVIAMIALLSTWVGLKLGKDGGPDEPRKD